MQYLSIRYTEHLAKEEIEPSVGSRGDSYDNALAGLIIGLYKTEVINLCGPWRSLEDVEIATLEWVWWFNHRARVDGRGWAGGVYLYRIDVTGASGERFTRNGRG